MKRVNNTVFFGFALADSMFGGEGVIVRRSLSSDDVKKIIEAGVEPCLNPSHAATIDAARLRFGIEVTIPTAPPKVSLSHGDKVVVMGVRGLPRLTDRHEYSHEEVGAATFEFTEYTYLDLRLRGFMFCGMQGGGGCSDVGDETLSFEAAEQQAKAFTGYPDAARGVELVSPKGNGDTEA